MVLRLFFDLGVSSMVWLPARMRVVLTWILPFLRSMSDQRRPRTSPRLIPERARRCHTACKRSPWIASTNSPNSCGSHAVISLVRLDGLRDALIGLTAINSQRTASRYARARTPAMLLTVFGDSGELAGRDFPVAPVLRSS